MIVTTDTIRALVKTLQALRVQAVQTPELPYWMPDGSPITDLKSMAAVLNTDETTAAYAVLAHDPIPVTLWYEATRRVGEDKRRVRTPAGALWYGQPIGSEIHRDKTSWASMIMRAAKAGGLTMSFADGTQPDSGYVVAARGMNKEIPDTEFFDRPRGMAALRKWTREHATAFDDPDAHLGIWYDTDHAEVVLDVSYVYADRDKAIEMGKRNNQQAIWDIANMAEVDTGGTGDRKAGPMAQWRKRGEGKTMNNRVHLSRPPKPVKGLTDDELDTWLGQVWDSVAQSEDHESAQ